MALYHGHARLLCPHALGEREGKLLLLAWQVGGGSQRGLGRAESANNWRCMDIDALSDLTVFPGPWSSAPPRPSPTRARRSGLGTIIASVGPRPAA